MNLKRLLILSALATLSTCALAQVADVPVIPPEEYILGTTIPDMLLQRSDIREELHLSAEQTMKFYDAEETLAAAAVRPESADPAADPAAEDTKPSYDAIRRRITEQVDRILTPDQMKRLRQISLQLTGYSALTHADVQKEFDFSKETLIKITDLGNEERRANESVFEKYEDGDLTADKLPEIIRNNRSALNSEIGKLLSSSQKEQFKSLCGKTFKASQTL